MQPRQITKIKKYFILLSQVRSPRKYIFVEIKNNTKKGNLQSVTSGDLGAFSVCQDRFSPCNNFCAICPGESCHTIMKLTQLEQVCSQSKTDNITNWHRLAVDLRIPVN